MQSVYANGIFSLGLNGKSKLRKKADLQSLLVADTPLILKTKYLV